MDKLHQQTKLTCMFPHGVLLDTDNNYTVTDYTEWWYSLTDTTVRCRGTLNAAGVMKWLIMSCEGKQAEKPGVLG